MRFSLLLCGRFRRLVGKQMLYYIASRYIILDIVTLVSIKNGYDSGWWLVVVAGAWWLVAGAWWLVAGGCWLLAAGCWLVAGGWWLAAAG